MNGSGMRWLGSIERRWAGFCVASAGRAGAALLALCFGLILSPNSAFATSISPEVVGAIPQSGATYPGEAAIFITVSHYSRYDIHAGVNGVERALEYVPELSGTTDHSNYNDTYAFRLVPEPSIGDQVEIVASEYGYEPGSGELATQYTVGPSVDAEPPAPPTLGFDVGTYDDTHLWRHGYYDYYTFYEYESDAYDKDYLETTWFVDLTDVPTTDPGNPVVYSITGPHGVGGASTHTAIQVNSGSSGPFNTRFLSWTPNEDLGSTYEGGKCVEVTAIDAAGRRSEPVQVCAPCHRVHIHSGSPGYDDLVFDAPVEPPWTEELTYCGGACATGGRLWRCASGQRHPLLPFRSARERREPSQRSILPTRNPSWNRFR